MRTQGLESLEAREFKTVNGGMTAATGGFNRSVCRKRPD